MSNPSPSRSNEATWFGHPAPLARLFSTEAWERFGYYGMRAFLSLYLAKHFLFNDGTANGLYGAYTSLVYLTPLFGGLLADRFLGSKRAVKFGAIMMSIGYLGLCFGGDAAKPYMKVGDTKYDVVIREIAGEGDAASTEKRFVVMDDVEYSVSGNEDGSMELTPRDANTGSGKSFAKGTFDFNGERNPLWVNVMFASLACVIVGNGFFKPNISTIVGSLYQPGDTRRDAGFTIFYMGINLGSFFSQIMCPWLAENVGWWAGFGLAAGGMLIAWFLFQFDGGRLEGYGERPASATRSVPDPLIYLGAVVAIPVVWFLLNNTMNATSVAEGTGLWSYLQSLPLLGKMLFGVFVVSMIGIPIWAVFSGTREEAEKMIAAIVMIVFSVVFWTLFEQAGSSLTFFADRNTDRHLGSWEMTAGQTQFFNPLFIVLLAPVFSMFWGFLARRNLEPSIPVKFAIALMLVGLGFLALVYGARFASPTFQVGIWWLILMYLIHSMGELCLSPVGLSMITKLSIPRVVGLMMGVWFLSSSVAQYVAGIVAQFAAVETVGGEVTNPKLALDTYVGVFQFIGLCSIGFGVVLLVVSPLLKKLMHGVR